MRCFWLRSRSTSVSVWIGEIQWLRRRGFGALNNPVLRPLETIVCKDAVVGPDGSAVEWPEADFIVGNPPWLGGKLLHRDLGDAAIDGMFAAYRGRVPAEADLACYWIDKAAEHVPAGKVVRSGLVVTNSIRGGANRRTLDRAMVCGLWIFDAWGDEPWEQDGAAVRASLLSPIQLQIWNPGRGAAAKAWPTFGWSRGPAMTRFWINWKALDSPGPGQMRRSGVTQPEDTLRSLGVTYARPAGTRIGAGFSAPRLRCGTTARCQGGGGSPVGTAPSPMARN
jgi:hypothetical protein